MVGAGPDSAESAMDCLTGGMGMSIIQGLVTGLAQFPQPVLLVVQLPLPQAA